MKLQSPPGMRDFYPDDMRLQQWLFDHWQRISEAFGFVAYEGPIFEYLELYEAKSGPGIVSELFNFEDRGGRRFALRPEMTPTLARMVAARANGLARPIKWYSLPRMCRAERPQRGRLREFFQWNVDILGIDDVLADAEVIAVAVAFLQAVGVTKAEAAVRISSRALAAGVLQAAGVPIERVVPAFDLLDRIDKLPADEFARRWQGEIGDAIAPDALRERLTTATLDDCLTVVREQGADAAATADQFAQLWENLAAFGVADYCSFDLRTVRGLAYYTGPVFEVFAKDVSLRALYGGGRYDNLTEVLGGPRVTGVGFGSGDVPVLEFLKELDKLPELSASLDVFVIDADAALFPRALEIVGALRRQGLRVDFSYKRQNVGKQFKQAAGRHARHAVVVGAELTERGALQVKDLSSGDQRALPLTRVLDEARTLLG